MMEKLHANKLDSNTKHSMVARIITGIFIALVGIPCIVIGGWHFLALVLLLTIIGAVELVHITDLKGSLKIAISVVTVICAVAITFYIFYRNQIRGGSISLADPDFLTNAFSRIDISVMLVTLMAAIYFVVSFVSEQFSVKHVFYLVTMIIVVAIGAQSFLYLRFAPFYFFNSNHALFDTAADIASDSFKYGQSTFLFAYVLIGVIMNDIGAYFIGVLFGKHKMNERISPKKTWEGFLGGVVFSLIASTVFAIVVTYCKSPILPIFDFTSSHNPYAVFFVVGISVLLPLIADVGDFIFSAIKRFWGVKDFSRILPGHGGILDRIDSLIFSAALVSCLIVFINLFFYGVEL